MEDIEKLKKYFLEKSAIKEEVRLRNYMLFLIGINAGFRIGDICRLQVENVTSWHIEFVDQKTDKLTRRKMPGVLKKAMREYIKGKKSKDFLFPSRQGGHITPNTAYKIIKKAADTLGIPNIATHSMRKTFGRLVYEDTKDIALVMDMLNHSNQRVTMIYIGKNQDSQDKALIKWGGV